MDFESKLRRGFFSYALKTTCGQEFDLFAKVKKRVSTTAFLFEHFERAVSAFRPLLSLSTYCALVGPQFSARVMASDRSQCA